MKYQNEEKFTALADRLSRVPISDDNWNGLQTIIDRCHNDDYHDFKSPDEAPDGRMIGPKMLMVEDLRKAGLEDEAQKVINGEYDQ